jgi:hypothetical protein
MVCVKERKGNKGAILKLNFRQVFLTSSKTEKTGCLEIVHKLTEFSEKDNYGRYLKVVKTAL